MNFPSLLLMSSLLVLIILSIAIISCFTLFLFRNWKNIKSAKPVWRNKYPSFEEFHTLFGRGDVMVSTVLVASSLQLSHPELAKVLKSHSSYKTDPWRRMIRTMTFIYIMLRATSSERQAVLSWLRKLHAPVPLFAFEVNVLVFATFTYGLVKTHEFLGSITPEQTDGVVKGIMSMSDKLDPKDRGRRVPNTMPEVEEYLRRNLSFDPDRLLEINAETMKLSSRRKEMEKQGIIPLLRTPWIFIKLTFVKYFVKKLSDNVLAQEGCGRGSLGRPVWWCLKKMNIFLTYFHYSLCPQMLTFDGVLADLAAGNPRMENVPMELYHEIFGSKVPPLLDDVPDQGFRRFSASKTHLPRMGIDERPMPLQDGFCEEVVELVKCSYYRGMLVGNFDHLPQHLGVIMDGNRRYSRGREYSSLHSGHQVGAHKLLQVVSWTFSSGVQNLTVWALSDDNLKRVPQELHSLYSLMAEYIRETMLGDAPFSLPEIRFRVVGDRSVLPDYLRDMIVEAEAATAKNSKFNLQIALGYGGRSEVTRAMKQAVKAKIAQENLSLEAAVEKITEADISRQIYSAQLALPPIDTIIRTSGENRLSGFALWESHHAEFAIVQENWPALRQSTFLRSVLDLSSRNRRFGA